MIFSPFTVTKEGQRFNMMMKKLALALSLTLLATPVLSQTTTTQQVLVDFDNDTVSNVTGYVKTIQIDGSQVNGTWACQQFGLNVGCRYTLTTPMTTTTPHEVLATAVINGVQREAKQTVDFSKGPKQPSLPRVVVTVSSVTFP
jgi:hypothetical protein